MSNACFSRPWQVALNGLAVAVVTMLSACGGGGPNAARDPGVSDDVSTVDDVVSQVNADGTIANCTMFPATAVFNTRIDDAARFPAHARSAAWITSIGSTRRMHVDWGSEDNPASSSYYGIPINTVDGSSATTLWPLANFTVHPSRTDQSELPYVDESDCAAPSGSAYAIRQGCNTLASNQRHFPFPLAGQVRTEGGLCNDPNTCGDHHVLVVEQGACRLWESYAAYPQAGQWYVMGTAAWDLNSLALRPKTWTSSDAAGLPITPFLARAAEASSGEVKHALRVTLRDSVLARTFVWPARHAAGGSTPTDGVPFGAVLRLKASFVIPSHWSPQAKALATAMKRYGLYVADIGSDFFVQGEPHASWGDDTRTQLQSIDLSQMEFVDLSSITSRAGFNEDSMAASW